MQPYPPPPPPPFPPPPPQGYYPPPPQGYYYPPPPPIIVGPEPKRGFAMGVLIAAAVVSGALLLIALTIKGEINEGRGEVRLANKIVWLLLLCGVAGIVDSIRAIYGRWKSALSVGLIHLILGVGLLAISFVLGGANGIRLDSSIRTIQMLAGALILTGVLSLIAISQVSTYGAWKRARQGLPPE